MKEITPIDLEEKIKKSNKLVVIDVRESIELLAGMIPEAIHIPLAEIQLRISEFEKDKEYVIVCHSGARSGVATQFLQAHGYNAANLVGGMIDWHGSINA